MKQRNSVFGVYNPFDNSLVSTVEDFSREKVHRILDKAKHFHCRLNADERSLILSKTASYLEKNSEKLATLISLESGLSLKDTIYEIGRVVNCAKYSAKVCSHIDKDTTDDYLLDTDNKPKLTVITEPLDLVSGITPFNHPMNQVAHKLFPAIILGFSGIP